MRRTAIVCLLLSGPLLAGPNQLFFEANSEYQKGDYGAAERTYREILDSGAESGPLYYNLGNACFKQKRLGDAVYYWEKAARLAPFDRETRENLQIAGRLAADRIEAPSGQPLERLRSIARGMLTASEDSWLALALFCAANLLFAARRKMKGALAGAAVTAVLSATLAASFCLKIYERNHPGEGVVVGQSVEVRSGPGTENLPLFTVHEGLKVRVLEESAGWCRVSLANGWSGWIPQAGLRVL